MGDLEKSEITNINSSEVNSEHRTAKQNFPFVESFSRALRSAIQGDLSSDQQTFAREVWETPYRVDGGLSAPSAGMQSLLHYVGYFRRLLSERTIAGAEKLITEIQSLAEFLHEENSHEAPLPLLRLTSKSHESLSLVCAHLYGESERVPVLIQGWFTDTLHHLNDVYEKMSEYFSLLHLRAGPTQKLVPSFLEALRGE